MKKSKFLPSITTELRSDLIRMPGVIRDASGILVFGKRIKSIIFTTDISIIMNNDADAILAVYPFTPHPAIINGITTVANMPVFAGVGGGTTQGSRCKDIALFAEAQGCLGVVVNAPTPIETIELIEDTVDIPIIGTIVTSYTDVASRLNAGVDILNVSGGKNTPEIVRRIRRDYPEIPIIATGGPSDETIAAAIEAGANAISFTPPSNGELFRLKMDKYREKERDYYMNTHDGMTQSEYEAYIDHQNSIKGDN